ncbi:MAG: ORF6N domain-containing protein [Elusimicrobiota bacterium]|jgi:hypothetical protein
MDSLECVRMSDPLDPAGIIYFIRGHRVMLSSDLANLYEVTPGALVQALKRNRDRFPPDFCFQLSREEYLNLKSQSVISSWGGAAELLNRPQA